MTRGWLSKRFCLGCLLGWSVAAGGEEITSPLEPGDTIAHFRIEAGLKIELVACEPEVVDPVAISFDEDGRLWVVEMRDYPHGPGDGKPPLSKIRVLTDGDGDGKYETSRVFAEELLFPTGLQPWQGGVIVTLAGEVIYLKDTDDDGRADVRETWYRGFVAENPQLRANHPRFALNHQVFIANGLRGGTIVDLRRPDQPAVEISGRDFCFDPRSGNCQAVSGNGQFGLTFDDFGNRFVCSNRQPLDHVVLENRYLLRNPLAAVPAVLSPVADAGEASRVFPLTSAWTTSNLHAGQFTAACGIDIYRGNALDAAYRGNGFTCEPTGSLVHREVLSPQGATFTASSPTPGREFLASPDAWFRPVNLEVGPDGALYVVDMYRAVIEHPQFMPSELQQRPDLRLGDDRGRIYRVVPADFARPAPTKRLSKATTDQLVALLEHDNVWQRETAARLLYERQDSTAVEPLTQLVRSAQQPAARVAALWALDGLGRVSEALLAEVLGDEHPRVREQAMLLAEPLVDKSGPLQNQIIATAAQEDDGRLKFQAVLTLGGVSGENVIAPLAALAIQQSDDVWMRRAVATARPENIAAILTTMVGSKRLSDVDFAAPELLALRELAAIVGSRRDADQITAIVRLACDDARVNRPVQSAVLLSLGQGLARRGGDLPTLIETLPVAEELTTSLKRVFDQAVAAALDESLSPQQRANAVELLSLARHPAAAEACLQLVQADASQPLRILAAASLALQPDVRVVPQLLANYAQQTPSVRAAIRDALSVRPNAATKLIEAVRSGQITRAELGAACENRLKQHRDEIVRKLAAEVLKSEVPAERRSVLADYQAAIELAGDPVAGKNLFRQHCATCHHISDVGVDVAPDISDSRVKTQAQLLTDILNPNQAIDNNYVSYSVMTSDGNVHTGLIAAETASSLTLRQPENKTLTLLRADIETIRSNGVSLMPEGFEKHLSHQQMADLIAFVKNWRYLEQAIPGTIGDKRAPSQPE